MRRTHHLPMAIVPISILMLMLGCIPDVFGAQSPSDSCLDCHTNVDQLKKITLELEKKKPKKSAETAGEG
jgi:hypothetical protein